MKINTKANIGDTLFFLYSPEDNGTKYYTLKKEKVKEISLTIRDDEIIYEIYSPIQFYRGGFYLNDGENSNVFIKEDDAMAMMNKLNNEIKKEIEENNKWEKEYKHKKAIEEINKIAKKNKIKVEFTN